MHRLPYHAKAEHDKNLNEDTWPCWHWCPTARIGSKGQKRAPNSASSARCRLRFAGHKISRVTPCCPAGIRPGNLDRVFRGNLRGPEEATLQSGPDHGQSRRLRQAILPKSYSEEPHVLAAVRRIADRNAERVLTKNKAGQVGQGGSDSHNVSQRCWQEARQRKDSRNEWQRNTCGCSRKVGGLA